MQISPLIILYWGRGNKDHGSIIIEPATANKGGGHRSSFFIWLLVK
jgi:hypothetical protein